MNEPNFRGLNYSWRELWMTLRHGDWSCGVIQDDEHKFGFFTLFYDGWHASLHVWPFYVSASY